MARLGKIINNVIRGEAQTGAERQSKYMVANRDKVNERNALRRKKAYEFINTLKAVACADCGGEFPPCAMDFDHTQGSKKDDISQLIASHYSLKALMEEIDKCEVVCANCHRVRTHIRRTLNG